jgi:hypothetical protein
VAGIGTLPAAADPAAAEPRGYAPRVVQTVFLVPGSIGATPCLADVIYNKLRPGNTWIVNREYDTNFDLPAPPFVISGEGQLGDIAIPLFSIDNPVSLSLYTDSGDKPGTLLEDRRVTVAGFPGVLTRSNLCVNPP